MTEVRPDMLLLEGDLITVYGAIQATLRRYLELLLPFESFFPVVVGLDYWEFMGGVQRWNAVKLWLTQFFNFAALRKRRSPVSNEEWCIISIDTKSAHLWDFMILSTSNQ